MGKILVDRHELESIRYGKMIGNGKEGSCYFSEEDNQIIKLFHLLNGKRKIYFSNLSSRQIAFPNDILLDNETGLIVGYTMDYLTGKCIHDGINKKMRLEQLKKSYTEMKKIIKSYDSICMNDLCIPNILIDEKNKFKLIDTSRWHPTFNKDIVNGNKEWFNRCIIDSIIINNLSWLREFFEKNKSLNLLNIYKNENDIMDLYEFIDLISYEIQLNFGYYPETIEDLTPKIYVKEQKNLHF